MKKLIPFCLAAAFVAPAISFVPANNIAVAPQFAAAAEAAAPTVNAPITTQQRLAKGTVTIYDYGQIKLHAYQTGDALSDECYVFETKQGLVLLESTILKDDIAAWKAYIKALNKPVAGALMAYHPNGFADYKDAPIYATAHAVSSWQQGGGIYAIVGGLSQMFGTAAQPVMPSGADKLTAGKSIELAGIQFNIIDAGDDAYSVEIPAIHTVYRHMMGSKVHNILGSKAHIAAELQTMKDYQKKNYTTILTSHYVPEGQAAVAQKIAYLEKVQQLADSCKTAQEFTQAVQKAFPDYEGVNYLQMTAGFLYK